MMLWLWLGIICVSALIEVFSWDMTSIWITCGGIVALIIYAFVPDILLAQIIPFIVISALLIIFIRPIVKKTIDKKTVKTNTSSLVGSVHSLLTDIKADKLGTIKVNDVIWSVESDNGDEISAGEKVEICDIKGNKFVVKKVLPKDNLEVDADKKEKEDKSNITNKKENN